MLKVEPFKPISISVLLHINELQNIPYSLQPTAYSLQRLRVSSITRLKCFFLAESLYK